MHRYTAHLDANLNYSNIMENIVGEVELKGKERALRALNFEKKDRIPMNGGWIKHVDFLEKASGINLRYGFRMTEWENPLRAAVQAYKNVGADIIAYNIILPELLDEITASGCIRFSGLNINLNPTYKTPEDFVGKYVNNLPSAQDVRESFDFQKDYDTFSRRIKMAQDECGEDILWIPTGDAVEFHKGIENFSYHNYLAAMVRHTKSMLKYFEYLGELARLHNEVMANAITEENLTPLVMLGSDICDNHGPMVSPKILNEIYFPHVRRAIEPFQKKGIKTIWHCDGNVNPIFETLLNMGIDGFQGFQEECGVNFQKIINTKSRSGKPLIVFGSISVTSTLPFGTVEDVKKDVERCIKSAEGRGGFVLMTANVIQPDTPIENIYAMYKHGAEFGKGK
jgi:hypothetical protein